MSSTRTVKEVKKYIRCTTESKRTGSAVEVEAVDGKLRACPLFRWKISIHEVDKVPKGKKADMQFVERAEFHLHPTFNDPVRVLTKNPFEVTEEGYGSFDIKVVIFFKDGTSLSFIHPLNLEKIKSESHHTVLFKEPTPQFLKDLEVNFSSSSSSNNTNGSNAGSKNSGGTSRKRYRDGEDDEPFEKDGELLYGYDVEELTDRLYGLQGEAIYKAVEVVQRYKTKTTYAERDEGEFHFDLFTLTPDAVHALWELTDQLVHNSTK